MESRVASKPISLAVIPFIHPSLKLSASISISSSLLLLSTELLFFGVISGKD
jgi:hypothetical protein